MTLCSYKQCSMCYNNQRSKRPLQQKMTAKLKGLLKIQVLYIPTFASELCGYHFKENQKNPQQLDMQTDPNIPETEDEKSDDHVYNCQCSACQLKFGSLPLLVQVIEENPEVLKFSEEDTNPEDIISQPSSSSGVRRASKEMLCPHCKKSFTHRGDLNKHIRKHTGEQPFTCSVCSKRFAHTSNLSRHLKVHSGDKPFKCHICAKTFSRKDKLASHQKSRLCRKPEDV